MRRVMDLVNRAAAVPVTVLLTGETGTGKELVARAIHAHEPRARRPVRRRSTAARCPSDLLESELFGHERGAFTGAVSERPGLFEVADGGTLFLDEIGEMPLAVQAKLLRVLQDGDMRRRRRPADRTVDVRVVAATNRDLEQARRRRAVPRGPLLPAQRVPICAAAAARAPRGHPRAGGALVWSAPRCRDGLRRGPADRAGAGALGRYAWPGNVRELQNVVERAVALGDPGTAHHHGGAVTARGRRGR